jgi:hypothetical protein
MSAPKPLLVRRQDFVELRVGTDDGDGIALVIGGADCGGAPR